MEGKRVIISLPRGKRRHKLKLKSGKFDFIRTEEELTTAILVFPAINHNLELQLQRGSVPIHYKNGKK